MILILLFVLWLLLALAPTAREPSGLVTIQNAPKPKLSDPAVVRLLLSATDPLVIERENGYLPSGVWVINWCHVEFTHGCNEWPDEDGDHG